MATPEEIIIANRTSRNGAAIGTKALTPRVVRQYLEDNNIDKETTTILDFGAGKAAAHAQAFVADGWGCLAYEFGDNIDPRVHCELALLNKYDIVYASNVLNVQSSLHMFEETIEQIKSVMKPDSVFFANYPLQPRKMSAAEWQMREMLAQHFTSVIWVGGKKNAPVLLMKK
jgi:hypothetical protein